MKMALHASIRETDIWKEQAARWQTDDPKTANLLEDYVYLCLLVKEEQSEIDENGAVKENRFVSAHFKVLRELMAQKRHVLDTLREYGISRG